MGAIQEGTQSLTTNQQLIMINKTELRIGNTVQLKNGMQLVIIEMGVYSLKVDIVGGNTYVGATYENLHGISLSPEILERYGFVEADDDGKYNLKNVWGVSLQHRYLADDGYDLYIFKQFIVQIHHLHHLQNVLHALYVLPEGLHRHSRLSDIAAWTGW